MHIANNYIEYFKPCCFNFSGIRYDFLPFMGAGKDSGKSNLLNSPGLLGIANIIECSFHCNRSSIPSSPNRFCTFG